MNATASLSLADRLALTLEGLCRAVAARVKGGALQVAMIVLVWGRVRRTLNRVQRLLARFRAGRVLVRGARTGGVRRTGRVSGALRLPRQFGWLLPLVPSEAASIAGQLRGVLADAEMVAFLAAVPQARRVLAPLCRMLGIEGEVLGIAAPVARVARVRVKRVRVKVKQSDLWRVPLPRGVLTAARRQGFGKLK